MKILLLVGLGGFAGSVLRLVISELIQTKSLSTFPYGTLSVNIIGCFVIGIVFGFVDKGQLSTEWRYFLATGLIGGFTTFSAFSYETFYLIRNDQFMNAMIYVLLSIVCGVIATAAGFYLHKYL